MHPGPTSTTLILVLVSVLLHGCTNTPEPIEPTFSTIKNNLFDLHCGAAECHASGSTESGLDLSSDGAYDRLINQPSTGIPSKVFVSPGYPDESYLLNKLMGTGIVGEQMPMGKLTLADSNVNLVRQWIARGAPE